MIQYSCGDECVLHNLDSIRIALVFNRIIREDGIEKSFVSKNLGFC